MTFPLCRSTFPSSVSRGWLAVGKRVVALGVLVGLALPMVCLADATVSDEPPTGDILAATIVDEPPGTIGWKNDSAADQWTGVTFQVNSNVTLDRITLGYSEVGPGAARAKVTVSIVQLGPEGQGFSKRLVNATTLQEETFTLPATMPEKGYLTFDFTDIALPPSPVPYAYVLRFDEAKSQRNFAFSRGKLEPEGGAVVLNDKSLIFRSDNGGQEYNNLLIRNVPVLYLQGTAGGAAGLSPNGGEAVLALAPR